MPKAMNELLSKSEIKFWMGIVAVIVSIVVANQNVVTQLALMKQELATLSEFTKATNDKFETVHDSTNKNSTAITVINTILEID